MLNPNISQSQYLAIASVQIVNLPILRLLRLDQLLHLAMG